MPSSLSVVSIKPHRAAKASKNRTEKQASGEETAIPPAAPLLYENKKVFHLHHKTTPLQPCRQQEEKKQTPPVPAHNHALTPKSGGHRTNPTRASLARARTALTIGEFVQTAASSRSLGRRWGSFLRDTAAATTTTTTTTTCPRTRCRTSPRTTTTAAAPATAVSTSRCSTAVSALAFLRGNGRRRHCELGLRKLCVEGCDFVGRVEV